jgi:hypothetical protein
MNVAKKETFVGVVIAVMVLGATPAVAQTQADTASASPSPTAPTGLRQIPAEKLGLSVGTGYLGSLALSGVVFDFGVRYLPIQHLALSFDLGYGVIGHHPDVQDRWWLIPSVAYVTAAGPVNLDFGVGLGLGATSGYKDLSAYVAAPFTPVWAFQLVPTARGHVMATHALDERFDLFARVDFASLLLGGNSIGSRVANPNPTTGEQIWYELVVGVQFHLL